MSIGLARRSTAAASVPESSSAPSAISIGRRLKYVYGWAFCTIKVTPLTSSPSQRTSLHDLERTKQKYFSETLDVYFDDIVDASERVWDMLENYKEVVEGLEDTNESVIAHRFNGILRILTVLSIVFLPATLIASIWGMNVGLPGGGDPTTGSSAVFWVLVSVMVIVIGGMIVFFRRRRWF